MKRTAKSRMHCPNDLKWFFWNKTNKLSPELLPVTELHALTPIANVLPKDKTKQEKNHHFRTSWAWRFKICSRPFHFCPVIVAGLGIWTISWGIRNMIQIKRCQCQAWDTWIKLTSYNTATLEPMLPVQNGLRLDIEMDWLTLNWLGSQLYFWWWHHHNLTPNQMAAAIDSDFWHWPWPKNLTKSRLYKTPKVSNIAAPVEFRISYGIWVELELDLWWHLVWDLVGQIVAKKSSNSTRIYSRDRYL